MDRQSLERIRERSQQREQNARIQVFSDYVSENQADVKRRAVMSAVERLQELAEIRYRIYGEALQQPMQKIAEWEYVDWHRT